MQGGKLSDVNRVEHAEDIELPFLGEVRRIGEERKRDVHAGKVHRMCSGAYYSG